MKHVRQVVRVSIATVFGVGVAAAQPTVPSSTDTGRAKEHDTDAILPWPTDFTRYTNPALCVAAARHARDGLQRTIQFQGAVTLAFDTTPVDDTTGAYAASVARKCGGHFTIANTPEAQWLDLLDLALLERNDSLAISLTQRLTPKGLGLSRFTDADVAAKMRSPGGKPVNPTTQKATSTATILDAFALTAIQAAVAQSPRQMDFLRRFAAQLATSSDPHHAFWEMAVQTVLLWDASAAFDRARMRETAERILALDSAVTRAQFTPTISLIDGNARWALGPSDNVEGRGGVTPLWSVDPIAMMQYARGQLGAIAIVDSPDNATVHGKLVSEDLSQTIRGLTNTEAKQRVTFPNVSAWYPARPAIGHVTVVVSRLEQANSCFAPLFDAGGMDWTMYGLCLEWPHVWIAEWLRKYGDRGLSVVVLDHTSGAFVERAMEPKTEAEHIQKFWKEHLHLPVTVGIIERSLSAPHPIDEEHPAGYVTLNADSSGAKEFFSGPITLVGAHGEWLYRGGPSSIFEALLAKAMEHP